MLRTPGMAGIGLKYKVNMQRILKILLTIVFEVAFIEKN